MKQSHVADLLGVSQATVSRWEAAGQAPSGEARTALLRLLRPSPEADAALKRLVEAASLPLHLICDATHALLAASPARQARWRKSATDLAGQSLWRYASEEIQTMEARREALGWFGDKPVALAFWTQANRDVVVPIAPGLTLWERIPLGDGGMARLVSTVAEPPPHATVIG